MPTIRRSQSADAGPGLLFQGSNMSSTMPVFSRMCLPLLIGNYVKEEFQSRVSLGNSTLIEVKKAFNVYYEFPSGDYSMLSFRNILDSRPLLFCCQSSFQDPMLLGSESRKSFTKHKCKLQRRNVRLGSRTGWGPMAAHLRQTARFDQTFAQQSDNWMDRDHWTVDPNSVQPRWPKKARREMHFTLPTRYVLLPLFLAGRNY